jgi:hypothetical protein
MRAETNLLPNKQKEKHRIEDFYAIGAFQYVYIILYQWQMCFELSVFATTVYAGEKPQFLCINSTEWIDHNSACALIANGTCLEYELRTQFGSMFTEVSIMASFVAHCIL